MIRTDRHNLLWDILSFVLHVALLLALIICTPVREIILPPKEPSPPPAAEMAPEKIERLDEQLAEARRRELERDIDALQTILNDMDVVRDQLRQDFDDVVQELAADIREELRKAAEEARKKQEEALVKQEEAAKTTEHLVEKEKGDLDKTAKEVRDAANHLFWTDLMEVSDAQSKAQNALDRIRSEAEFAGYEKVAEAAKELRDAQIAAARMQTAEAKETIAEANDIAEHAQAARDRDDAKSRAEEQRKNEAAQNERREKEQAAAKAAEAKRDDAEQRRADAEAKRADAEKRRDAANRERDAAQNDKRKAEAAKRDAENRARSAKSDEEKAKFNEAADAEKAKAAKADADAKAAQERATAAERERAEAQKTRDSAKWERDRADSDRRNAESKAENAKASAQRFANAAAEQDAKAEAAQKRMDSIAAAAAKLDAAKQKERQANARKAQEKVLAAMSKLDTAIEKDMPTVTSHADMEFAESELATQDVSNMTVSESYEFAMKLEEAVTESYREVVAASTALTQHLSLEEAERLTDVAKPVRDEIDSELLDGRARTAEDLAAQKEARYKAAREAENMVDASMAMMDEAFRIVGAGDGGEFKNGDKRKARGLKRLMRGDLKGHGETPRAERFIALSGLAGQMEMAAAEDKGMMSKDLTALTKMGGTPHSGRGLAENDYVNATGDKRKIVAPAAKASPEGEKAPNPGTGAGLLPGNVLSLNEDGARGRPGEWMYLISWWVIGPFPNPGRENITRKFPPESVVDLDAAYEGEGGLVKWTFTQARNGIGKYARYRRAEVSPPSKREYTIWYGWTQLIVDQECDVWLAAGSDDRSDVWVNGMKVWASGNNLKEWSINEGFRKVHLRQGANDILVRLENGHGPTGFSVCVSPHETPPPL